MQVGAEPTESDILVANIFARLGSDIEFIAPSKAYRVRTPDINIIRRFTKIKKIKRLKVITKTHRVLDLK